MLTWVYQTYYPTSEDVRRVHAYLQHFIPAPLATDILNLAHYRPLLNVEQKEQFLVSDGDRLCVATPPLTAEQARSAFRLKVVVKGHDQGWSSNDSKDHGTTRGSWTWFTIGVEDTLPITAPHHDTDDRLATNLHATRETQRHVFEWTRDAEEDSILSQLRAGQSVCIWAHARWVIFTQSNSRGQADSYFQVSRLDKSRRVCSDYYGILNCTISLLYLPMSQVENQIGCTCPITPSSAQPLLRHRSRSAPSVV